MLSLLLQRASLRPAIPSLIDPQISVFSPELNQEMPTQFEYCSISPVTQRQSPQMDQHFCRISCKFFRSSAMIYKMRCPIQRVLSRDTESFETLSTPFRGQCIQIPPSIRCSMWMILLYRDRSRLV